MTFTQHEWLDMFSALDSETRFNIMVLLNKEGDKNEAEISELFDLKRHWFMVHMNALMSAQLIDYTDRPTYDHWGITEKGKKVLGILSWFRWKYDKMSFSENIRINLTVVQPDWDLVRSFLIEHKDCDSDMDIWFHSVAQCEGKFKLYLQLYCSSCPSKLIPYKWNQSSKESAKSD